MQHPRPFEHRLDATTSENELLTLIGEQADIVVAAAGRPGPVDAHWIRPGAVVIDVGINRIEHADGTRLVGDVDGLLTIKLGNMCLGSAPIPGSVVVSRESIAG